MLCLVHDEHIPARQAANNRRSTRPVPLRSPLGGTTMFAGGQLVQRRKRPAPTSTQQRRRVHLVAARSAALPKLAATIAPRFPDAWGAVYRRPQLERRM